jgi:hypothetical protein
VALFHMPLMKEWKPYTSSFWLIGKADTWTM